MKIETIKKKMLSWTDFYGGDMYMKDDIKNATSKTELAGIFETYRRH